MVDCTIQGRLGRPALAASSRAERLSRFASLARAPKENKRRRKALPEPREPRTSLTNVPRLGADRYRDSRANERQIQRENGDEQRGTLPETEKYSPRPPLGSQDSTRRPARRLYDTRYDARMRLQTRVPRKVCNAQRSSRVSSSADDFPLTLLFQIALQTLSLLVCY